MARRYSIRVVPTINAPGHVSAWLLSPELRYLFEDEFPSNPGEFSSLQCFFGELNVFIPETYSLLRSIYQDLALMFPDLSFHLEGNDIQTQCYEKNMKKNEKSQSFDSQISYFFQQSLLELIFWEKKQVIMTRCF